VACPSSTICLHGWHIVHDSHKKMCLPVFVWFVTCLSSTTCSLSTNNRTHYAEAYIICVWHIWFVTCKKYCIWFVACPSPTTCSQSRNSRALCADVCTTYVWPMYFLTRKNYLCGVVYVWFVTCPSSTTCSLSTNSRAPWADVTKNSYGPGVSTAITPVHT